MADGTLLPSKLPHCFVRRRPKPTRSGRGGGLALFWRTTQGWPDKGRGCGDHRRLPAVSWSPSPATGACCTEIRQSLAITSSASTTPPPAAQPSPQWITPALLVSLIALMAVISFGLLTELRGFRAKIKTDLREFRTGIKADLRSFQQEMRQESRREIETAMGGVNSRTDTLRTEIKADNQQLASPMDKPDADLNGRMDRLTADLNGRIDQVYQLLPPARPKP